MKGKQHSGVAPKDVHPMRHEEKLGRIYHGRKAGGRLVDEKNPETHEEEERHEEAEAERKHGGRTKKRVGKVDGEKAHCHGGRAPRKSGGAVRESSPFSAAHSGTPATGRKLDRVTE